MYLNLEALAVRGGERHHCKYSVDVAPAVLGGVSYQVLFPDGVTVAVDRVAGGFLATLSLEARVYGPCTRCLGDVDLSVHAEQQEFAPTSVAGWAESESSVFIKDMILDVSGLAREAVVLALPDQVLCSSTCKGLCSLCGQDLNQGPCGCVALEISEPMG